MLTAKERDLILAHLDAGRCLIHPSVWEDEQTGNL